LFALHSLVYIKLELLPEVEWDNRVKEISTLQWVYSQFDEDCYMTAIKM